jgi:hypothetical protein
MNWKTVMASFKNKLTSAGNWCKSVQVKKSLLLAGNWCKSNSSWLFWLGAAVLAAASIYTIIHVFSNGSGEATTHPVPGAGWFFLKLAFAGLIWAAYAARAQEKLAWAFAGLAVLVFLVLLGKLEDSWPGAFDFHPRDAESGDIPSAMAV